MILLLHIILGQDRADAPNNDLLSSRNATKTSQEGLKEKVEAERKKMEEQEQSGKMKEPEVLSKFSYV